MRLRAVESFHVAVPLKSKIRHASHERTTSDNLVVRVRLANGQVGYGEGVPREYVTGETIATAFDALASLDAAAQIGSPDSAGDAARRIAALTLPTIENDPRGMAGNAARCALELALFDAYARHFGLTVGQLVRTLDEFAHLFRPKPTRVRYGAAITSQAGWKELDKAIKFWVYGFRDVKVKVGVDGQDDEKRVRRLRWCLGRGMDIRLDANESWRVDEAADRVRPLLPARPSVLEQPVAHAEIDQLAGNEVRRLIPVMLDESLCGYPDGLRAVKEDLADYFNVRLSKCGGIVPSLRLVDLATKSGLGLQLGCHPGETGILSAAGRHFAANVQHLRYVEGSYDGHVLAENVIREDITFGQRGWGKPLTRPGLGVTVVEADLTRLCRRRQDVVYD
jgi:muconate cycloisomerase